MQHRTVREFMHAHFREWAGYQPEIINHACDVWFRTRDAREVINTLGFDAGPVEQLQKDLEMRT